MVFSFWIKPRIVTFLPMRKLPKMQFRQLLQFYKGVSSIFFTRTLFNYENYIVDILMQTGALQTGAWHFSAMSRPRSARHPFAILLYVEVEPDKCQHTKTANFQVFVKLLNGAVRCAQQPFLWREVREIFYLSRDSYVDGEFSYVKLFYSYVAYELSNVNLDFPTAHSHSNYVYI